MLHAELQRVLVPGVKGIRHPLVWLEDFDPSDSFEVSVANALLQMNRARTTEALQARDFLSYVMAHTQPYRFKALQRVVNKIMPHKDRAALIETVFTTSRNIYPDLKGWKNLFRSLLGKDYWGTLQTLPEQVPLYRGGLTKGIAWYMQQEPAEWHIPPKRGYLWHTTVPREKIAAYFPKHATVVYVFPLPEFHTVLKTT